MKKKQVGALGVAVGLAMAAAMSMVAEAEQPSEPMSFFVTSVGLGDGANLGGLAGADAHCQTLAAAAGRGRCLPDAPAVREPLRREGGRWAAQHQRNLRTASSRR